MTWMVLFVLLLGIAIGAAGAMLSLSREWDLLDAERAKLARGNGRG